MTLPEITMLTCETEAGVWHDWEKQGTRVVCMTCGQVCDCCS